MHYFVVQLFLLCHFFWKYVCFLCHLREDFITSDAEQQPTHFTVGVQTDYRESETQTDPYSPEYVIQPGTTPSELLQMAALTWGIGMFIVFFICYMNRDGTLISNFIGSWQYNYLALFSPSYSEHCFLFKLAKHNLYVLANLYIRNSLKNKLLQKQIVDINRFIIHKSQLVQEESTSKIHTTHADLEWEG